MANENIIQTVEFKNVFNEYVKETELSLPDYCPGIFRVVKLIAQPFIKSLSAREGGSMAEGQVLFTLLYKAKDDDTLHAYCVKDDFSFFTKEEGDCFAFAQTLYSSCRLTSDRRATLKAVINIKIIKRGVSETPIYTPCKGIVARERSFVNDTPVTFAAKRFTLRFENDHADCPDALLYTEICPVTKETKVVKGRVLIKGEAIIRGVYSYDDNTVKSIYNRLPFSQIIDAPDALDTDNCRPFISVSDIDCTFTRGENSCITSCDVSLNLYIDITRPVRQKIYTDCFCPNYKTEIKKAPFGARAFKERVSFSSSLSFTLNLSDGVKSLTDTAVFLTPDSLNIADSRLKISGSALIRAIYLNEDNETAAAEKNLPFECFMPYENTDLLSVFGEICTLSQDASYTENTITVRIETQCFAYVYNVFSENILQSATPCTDAPIKISRPEMSVCFAKKGEEIWEIAKEFCALPERIKEVNGLNEEVLTEDRKLILLRVDS